MATIGCYLRFERFYLIISGENSNIITATIVILVTIFDFLRKEDEL